VSLWSVSILIVFILKFIHVFLIKLAGAYAVAFRAIIPKKISEKFHNWKGPIMSMKLGQIRSFVEISKTRLIEIEPKEDE
jgi:hypothetical protein